LLLVLLAAAPSPPGLRSSSGPHRAAQVHWRAYGPAAFAEAKRTGKPVFLNLAAVWCHWCHVFDETTLSDPAVIALLDAKFVSVRVDADQNPGIERRYLHGGWPTNVFLDEEGAVLGGGTYLVPARFLAMARTVVQGYGGDRAALREALGGAADGPRSEVAPGPIGPALAVQVGRELRGAVDPVHGGFGGAPKFPHGDAVALLAYLGRTRGDEGALRDARAALRAMARGGLFDPVEGGFFRYAMHADWSAPHHEKMLATNAALLGAWSEAYAASHDESLRGPAESIASYLVTHLWDEKQGGFYGSQDADETYYTLDAAGRAARKPPRVDHTFLADRMGLAARALVRAAVVFHEPSLARYAERTEDLVLTRMRASSSGLVRHALSAAPGSKPLRTAGLDDSAQTLLALLDLSSFTGDPKYLKAAAEVLGAAQRALGDASGPGYFDRPADPDAGGLLAQRLKPLQGNVLMAWALARLGAVQGDAALTARARATLAAFAGNAHGLGAADLARAADAVSGQLLRIVVVAKAHSPLCRAAAGFDDPRREVRRLDPNARGARLGALVFPPGPPAVYACAGTLCSRPLRDPSTLDASLKAFLDTQFK